MLQNDMGDWVIDPDELESLVTKFYVNLFSLNDAYSP